MLAKFVDYSIFIVLGLNLYVWGEGLNWQFDQVGLLELFPLLGLIAFSTMWWHFFAAFMHRLNPSIRKHEGLHRTSAYWVFVSFMLHPLLLIFWGLDNGLGSWPIDIFRLYVGEPQMFYIYLGLIGLIGFLLFDVARVLSKQEIIQRNRHIITAISDVSFVIILIHSLQLGQHLQAGWFRTYWLLLGATGIGFIAYRYYFQYRHRHAEATS